MRHRITIIVVGILICFFAAVYLTVEKVYDGYILVIGNNVYDPVGAYKEIANRVTRDCSSVEKVDANSKDWQLVIHELQRTDQDSLASPRIVLKVGRWFLVESDFSDSEPGVLLLESTQGRYNIVTAYGGTAAPFKDAPIIRGYLEEQAPSAPRALIQCYDPVGAPFSGL